MQASYFKKAWQAHKNLWSIFIYRKLIWCVKFSRSVNVYIQMYQANHKKCKASKTNNALNWRHTLAHKFAGVINFTERWVWWTYLDPFGSTSWDGFDQCGGNSLMGALKSCWGLKRTCIYSNNSLQQRGEVKGSSFYGWGARSSLFDGKKKGKNFIHLVIWLAPHCEAWVNAC